LQEGIDPIGSMIGPGGSRINAIKKEINNEQIDIVKYNDDLKTYITNICYPVKINSVIISDDLISIICNESENNTDMQKLIGRQGSNIKLIQKLLDRTVEIISVSELDELKNDISVNNEKVEYSNFGLKNTRKSFTPTPRRDKSDTGTTDYEDLMNEFNKD
jgi:N utilization substance protein A